MFRKNWFRAALALTILASLVVAPLFVSAQTENGITSPADGASVSGTVTEVNHEKGRLSVMVSIFGRDTRVDDLEFWQVEQATAENAS